MANRETVHACPPRGSNIAPCCGRPANELPRDERITVDASRVTCNTEKD